MGKTRIAYLALNAYPDAASDEAVRAAAGLAAPLAAALHVTAFAVKVPKVRSPLGSLVLDVPAMARVVEERSRAECRRLRNAAQEAGSSTALDLTEREVVLDGAFEAAADEARYFDFSLLPWSGESVALLNMAEALVFGSGRPAIVVPASARLETVTHLAIAWDGSRVAARALGDALALLPESARITALTVQGEKPLAEQGMAQRLASNLEKRGLVAQAIDVALGKRTIAAALQEAALEAGASLLAMGGFGHSRIRDFILGGATRGVLCDLRLPVLISH